MLTCVPLISLSRSECVRVMCACIFECSLVCLCLCVFALLCMRVRDQLSYLNVFVAFLCFCEFCACLCLVSLAFVV